MRSPDAVDRQLGTATYLIDFLALRVGGEKDTGMFVEYFDFTSCSFPGENEEADTVGCCSLRVEHTTLNSETEEVTFDFLGKDSIRYFNTVKAFKNLVGFCKGKKPDEDVFDRINEELQQQQQGSSTKIKTKKITKAQPDLVGAAAAAAASGAAAAATEGGRGAADVAGATKNEKFNDRGEKEESEEAPILDINLSDVNQLVQFYNDANR
ncbi:hypothetical protein ACSSS7_005906 [Eimeria intestinalis]